MAGWQPRQTEILLRDKKIRRGTDSRQKEIVCAGKWPASCSRLSLADVMVMIMVMVMQRDDNDYHYHHHLY